MHNYKYIPNWAHYMACPLDGKAAAWRQSCLLQHLKCKAMAFKEFRADFRFGLHIQIYLHMHYKGGLLGISVKSFFLT